MKFSFKHIFRNGLVMASAFALFISCNKDVESPQPIPATVSSGQSIVEYVNGDANLTILKAAIARAGTNLTALLSDRSGVFTFFAPTDAAFQAAFQFLGIPASVGVNAFRPGQLDTIIRYHIVGGQAVTGSMIPETFPNLQLPSQFVLAPPSATLPPGLRLPVFPSKRATINWANNVPLVQTDISVANGVIHKTAAVLLPPSQFLWDRINTDANLTYLKAAIQKADEGVAPASTLQATLLNPAANLTVFAPTNTAFQQILTALITQALIAQGVPPATAATQAAALASSPAVFTNPAVAAVLTPQTVQGIVVYHMLGNRAFSVNIPATATTTPTLLNRGIPTHPGVTLQATFGATGVTAATVKGAANTTPSNISINPTPAPGGTSDQNYINGVLHIIDQVLRPQ
jgi:uncharacterized surface protein with fasciclin (FAS1) repeats